MTKEIWLNLPVKNVNKSKEFFSKIGFSLNEKQSGDEMVCFEVGTKQMTVLFFAEEAFTGIKTFTQTAHIEHDIFVAV